MKKKWLYILLIGFIALCCVIYLISHKENFQELDDINHRVPVEINLPSSHLYKPSNMAISMRRGVCRTMNQNLKTLSMADTNEQTVQSLKSITVLTNEMINYYQTPLSDLDPNERLQTQASEEIWIDKQAFRKSRQDLNLTLQQDVSLENNYEIALEIKTKCQGCHDTFVNNIQ